MTSLEQTRTGTLLVIVLASAPCSALCLTQTLWKVLSNVRADLMNLLFRLN